MGANIEKLKLIMSRIVEACSLRELLDADKLNETLAEMPHVLEALKESVAINTNRFDQSYVEPLTLSRLSHFNMLLARSNDDELEGIANTVLFIMEKEIYNISKKILAQ